VRHGQARRCHKQTLMLLMRSCTPPRSPPDMPSTSSMMSACFFTLPSKLTAQFVTISFTMFAHLPFRPDFTSDSAYTHTVNACARVHVRNVRLCAPRTLPRASLALTSMTSKPSALQIIFAALVLPMPGGPLISTAFLGASFPFGAAAWPRCVLKESSQSRVSNACCRDGRTAATR